MLCGTDNIPQNTMLCGTDNIPQNTMFCGEYPQSPQESILWNIVSPTKYCYGFEISYARMIK
jgi:hypothetical protein